MCPRAVLLLRGTDPRRDFHWLQTEATDRGCIIRALTGYPVLRAQLLHHVIARVRLDAGRLLLSATLAIVPDTTAVGRRILLERWRVSAAV